jgi:polyphosphate kinase
MVDATPPSDRFLNREFSWLEFDRRVLEFASDPHVPLLERVKLCSIVSSNLDEFFAIRMAGLEREAANDSRSMPDRRTAGQAIAEARRRIQALQRAQDELWLDDLAPQLALQGIPILSLQELGRRDLRSLAKQFHRWISPLLTPIAVSAAARFPHVASLALNIGAIVRDEVGGTRRFVRVNVPDDLPSFLEVGTHGAKVAVEDAILHFLPMVIGNAKLEARGIFRITRDADLSIANDADDLLEAVEEALRRRSTGAVVRLELNAGEDPELVNLLKNELDIRDEQIYESRAPLALARLIDLTAANRPELQHSRWQPVTCRAFADRDPEAVLARIRRGDVLVHHPYDSFDSSVQAFVAAARDPKVAALKATVYRTEDRSPTLASLVETAEEEKQAVALVELKARFDERRNIEWARALDQAGVDVVYGVAALKVHAKLALLVRREDDGLRRYVHIGTGNYHASNASNYEDLSLFTADQDIAGDVADLFNAVTGLARPAAFRKLLVGPWFLRDGLLREIDRVISAARAGGPARIRIKINALADPEIVDALYAASLAGVNVDIITRGICILRPGVPGLSECITVRSVLGRFLEHSRILSFETASATRTWIGSADLMPRNLDRRVEVLVPVEDASLRTEVAAILDALADDTRCSWELDADGTWRRVQPKSGEVPVSAQDALMARAAKRMKDQDFRLVAPVHRAA